LNNPATLRTTARRQNRTEARAAYIDNGERSRLDPDGIDDQRIAFEARQEPRRRLSQGIGPPQGRTAAGRQRTEI